jgi:hypothetical protein
MSAYDKRDHGYQMWNEKTQSWDHYTDDKYTHSTKEPTCWAGIGILILCWAAWFIFW